MGFLDMALTNGNGIHGICGFNYEHAQ